MLPRIMRRLVLSVLSVLACSASDVPASGESTGDGESTTDTPTSTTATATDADSSTTEPVIPDDAPTFYRDILPVIAAQCQNCHAPGGIGVFDLADYETAKVLAPSLVAMTQSRTMPPFVADNTGDCNTFADARWLTDEEIELFARWDEYGAPEGDASLPRPEPPSPAVLEGDEILTLTTPEAYAPVADDAGGADDYQCFLVDPGVVDAPRYLVGYDVLPGNPAMSHHLIGFLVDPEAMTPLGSTNGSLMDSLDAASPDQPGWDCFGAAGNGVLVQGTPVTWAPGAGAFNFPEGTGIRIDPGYKLVVQMHYNLAAGEGADQTDLQLSMVDEVEREAVNALDDRFLRTLFNGTAIEIPPGEESWVWKWSAPIREWDSRIAGWERVEILGMLPHMHGLGRRMQVTIKNAMDDSEQCGIYVDRWDFDWQQAFMYETPIIVSPSDQLEIVCDWDSSSKDTPTTPGLGTSNEMCLLGVYVTEAQ